MKQNVPNEKVNNQSMVDPGHGKHLWVLLAVYQSLDPGKVIQSKSPFIMDLENLLSVEGPACYKCEQHYTEKHTRSFCRGSMEDVQ